MPNIKLKGQTGEVLTFEDVERVYFDSADQDGEVVYYTHGTAVTKSVEPNFASGDMNVPIADGELVTQLTIEKPDELNEDNIRNGKTVAGVKGKFIGDTEEVTVGTTESGDTYDLDFSGGNVVVEPTAAGKVISKATILPPITLKAENIRKDVEIGGIVGELVHVGTDPYIECAYNEGGEITAMKLYGFTEIPAACFAYKPTLTSIDLSASPGITNIGQYAFNGCTALTSIDIPDSVTNIGQYAFNGCTALTSIDIPDNVTSIGQYAFSGCTALTSIDIPDSVTNIGNYAFFNCTKLATVTIGNGVTSMGNCVFQTCKALTSVTISDGATSVGSYGTFQYCTALTSIDIPDSVTSLCNYLFNTCTALTSINIPSGVTNIGNYAFQDCTTLTSIDIPDSVTSIGQYAFSGCTALTSAIFEDTTTWYVGTSAGATTTQLSVTNKSTAATYLKNTHKAKYWTKK